MRNCPNLFACASSCILASVPHHRVEFWLCLVDKPFHIHSFYPGFEKIFAPYGDEQGTREEHEAGVFETIFEMHGGGFCFLEFWKRKPK